MGGGTGFYNLLLIRVYEPLRYLRSQIIFPRCSKGRSFAVNCFF